MNTDYYQRRFLQLAEQSVDLGRVKAFALISIGDSIAWLMSEMAELRHTHTAALALQQAILHREVLQEKLEEFIYQSRKTISSLLDPSDKSSPVSKALIIRSFFLSVKNAGISTSVIRGIPNKEAFDKCLDQAKAAYRQLGQNPEVRKAIAAEEASEKKCLADEAQREAEKAQREAEEQQRRAEEERKLETERINASPIHVARTSLCDEVASKELRMSVSFDNLFLAVLGAFKKVGRVQSVEHRSGRMVGSIGSGFLNMNNASITVEVQPIGKCESKVAITATAQEGLIPQNTAAKAISRMLEALGQPGRTKRCI